MISERIRDKTEKIKELKKQNNDLKHELSAIQNELYITQMKLNKWIERQQNGYTALKITNDYITEQINIPKQCLFTYQQDIKKEIGTTMYQKYPFYVFKNGKIEIDQNNYIKYKGVY